LSVGQSTASMGWAISEKEKRKTTSMGWLIGQVNKTQQLSRQARLPSSFFFSFFFLKNN
jgi:hypothetical protein